MADLITFPLILRPTSSDPTPPRKARTVAFPLTRRIPLIGRVARRMCSLQPKEAGDYLIKILEKLQDELLAARIEQETIDDQLIAFAIATKAAARADGRRRPGGTA